METAEILHGQLIIGPAGSGKTTYCRYVFEHLQNISNREVILVNLDPDNNPNLSIRYQIDISDLIKLSDVMQKEKLGPNGSFLFCMDFLEKNLEWLQQRIYEEYLKAKQKILIEKLDRRRPYILFDCPGQIELYTNYPVFKNIVAALLNYNIVHNRIEASTINMVDSHYANDPGKFISVVLNSLLSMLHIESPFINVLSKADLMEKYGETDFGINFYSSYLPLDVKDPISLAKIINSADFANGFNMDSSSDYRIPKADFEASKYGNFM
ncbi:GPN-loop GTPase 2 [Sarcoptes scabiei]|uniref:GPN-loop GTPase 2 n=1 Tax=Sarcoptes scabiei TaxID=52283 RepID=A0A834R9U0_SARSC|nr:GPN-loop GTPase 2 [Sarcoptes scabiei]